MRTPLVATAVGTFVLSIALASPRALADPADTTAQPIVAKDCRILVLPVLEKSGRTGDEKDEFIRIGTETLHGELSKLGFTVVDGDVNQAAKELKIDLLDDAQRNKSSYAQLAQKLGARLVLVSAIQGVFSAVHTNLLSTQKVGYAVIQFAVYDASTEQFVINGPYKGKLEGKSLLPVADKYSTKRTGALRQAFHQGVEEFAHTAGLDSHHQKR